MIRRRCLIVLEVNSFHLCNYLTAVLEKVKQVHRGSSSRKAI